MSSSSPGARTDAPGVRPVLAAPPLAGPLGLVALPAGFFAALVALVLAYLVLVEAAKALFYRRSARPAPTAGARSAHERHVRRRARRFVRDPSAPALPSPRR